jgi:hypothetical protein
VQEAAALQAMGMGAVAQRSVVAAARYISESLELSDAVGERMVAATTLEVAAALLASTDPGRAARVLAAVEAHRETHGTVREGVDQPAYERALQAVRDALGDAAFAAASTDGRGLTLEDAVAEARAALVPLAE